MFAVGEVVVVRVALRRSSRLLPALRKVPRMNERVLESIHRQPFDERTGSYRCGCQQRGNLWDLCQYHEGYGDGLERLRPENARLKDALEWFKAAEARLSEALASRYMCSWTTGANDDPEPVPVDKPDGMLPPA